VRLQAKRFNWLSAGRRWRKTTLVMAIAVESALKRKRIIWGAPTYNQVRIGFNETRQAAAGIADFNVSRMEVTFPGGGVILFRSLDNPDNARGETADGVVIDETADVAGAAWYEVLRPMLIDTGGWLWAIGTPKGRNWFYIEHSTAQDKPDAIAWQVPTLGVRIDNGKLVRSYHPMENPHVPFDEVENLWRTMSERAFQQEILAQFIETSGGVFRGVMACATAKPETGRRGDTVYVAGLDWALSYDFTVLSIINVNTRELVYLDRYNGVDYSMQRQRIKAACDRFGIAGMIAEANAMGKPNNDELRRMGLPVRDFVTTNATKADAIESLAAAFEQGNIRILDDPTLIAELQAYEVERLPSGMVRYSAPDSMHDDMVVSLALAWHGASAAQRKRATVREY